MFKMKVLWTGAALAAVTAVLTAQTQVGGHKDVGNKLEPPVVGGHKDAGNKLEPIVGDAGFAVCFGDGTGAKCPVMNPGLLGHGCDNYMATGGAVLGAQGFPKISNDSMALTVASLPLGTTTIYMQGVKLASPPNAFGYGLMCLGGPVTTLAVKRTVDSTSKFPEVGDPALGYAGKLPRLGTTMFYQVVYRDVHPINGIDQLNSTNAWMTVWVP
jgi:hypothetical protein